MAARRQWTRKVDPSSDEFREGRPRTWWTRTPRGAVRRNSVFEAYLAELAAARQGDPGRGDIRYVFDLARSWRAYPGARVIVMVRDPRDVLGREAPLEALLEGLKQLPRNETLRLRVNYHPVTMSLLWSGAIAPATACGDPRVHELRFEDVLADGGRRYRGLWTFIG